MKTAVYLLSIAYSALFSYCVLAEVVYLSTEEFLAKTFTLHDRQTLASSEDTKNTGGVSPAENPFALLKAKTLWLRGETKQTLASILGHKPAALRLRYWQRGEITAWIMDEIGKEHPITIGVALKACQVNAVDVLVYRESRGGEVRYQRFTRQFKGAVLNSDYFLDRNIDGISGATLSVRAMSNVVRSILYLAESQGLCTAGDERG